MKVSSNCPRCALPATGDSQVGRRETWRCPVCTKEWDTVTVADSCDGCGKALYRNGVEGPCKGCVDFNKWEAPQIAEECVGNPLSKRLRGWTHDEAAHTGLPQAARAALGILAEKETLLRTLAFLNDLCHPEQYGHAVTAEVRARARGCATELDRLLEG